MIIRKISYALLVTVMCFMISGCSAEKNTNLSRAYHGLTSHYNVFFNGHESFKKGVKKAEEAFVDDFSKILSIFTYVDENIAGQVAPEMDRTIQKSFKVITLHSITAKPERKKGEMTDAEQAFYNQPEYNKWIDDSYLLMAKAQFYKHDFHIAINTLKLIIIDALDEKTRKEAYIWLARTYCELEEYKDAEDILIFLEDQGPIPDKLIVDYNTTYADYYLKQEKFLQAIPRLTVAVDKVHRKKEKYRYSFILAQLHEEVGNFNEASELYRRVIRMNPPYEMTFNSRINLAGSFDVTQGNSNEIRKDLKKLLRDNKNIDYQDQIYYAYGNISLKEGNIEEAIEYFRKSAASSVSNSSQKGKSFLTIADIYFERLEYKPAQAYYDSAVSFLDREFPDYEQILSKSQHLTELVTHINIVELEDSLQMVAGMTSTERSALIDRIIREINEQEKQEREQVVNQQVNRMNYYESERRFKDDIEREGNWYYYNPTALNFGRNEFRNKWGNRRLEDNWRRSNKSVIDFGSQTGQDVEENREGTDTREKVADKKSREYYIQNVPLTDSMIQASNIKIAEALFNIGQIYKDDFYDTERSVSSFEELNRRFPDSEFRLPSCYYLYEINKNLPDQGRETYYKNLIITRYPDSEYARIIMDPEYYSKLKAAGDSVKIFYEDTYAGYLNNQFASVIDRCNHADSVFAGDQLCSKFKFLRAMAIGSSQNIRAYKEALSEVVNEFPDSPEKENAAEIIAFLNKAVPVLKEEEEEIQAQEIYAFNEDTIHYFIAVAESGKVDINQLIFNIINYNLDNFPQTEYNAMSESLNDTLQVISVRDFPSLSDALEYASAITSENSVLDELQGTLYFFFIISDKNYNTLLDDKSISKYEKFFKKHYLR